MSENHNVDPRNFGGANSVAQYGRVTPTGGTKFEPDDLEESVAVLTLAGYEEMDVEDTDRPSRSRRTAVVTFEEAADKLLWLNKSAVQALVTRFGANPALWIGQRVPVERVTRQFEGRSYEKVAVMPAEEWDEYIKPATTKTRSRRGKK